MCVWGGRGRESYGIIQVSAWDHPGFSMGSSRFQHGIIQVSAWDHPGFRIGSSRVQHGIIKGSAWDHQGLSEGFFEGSAWGQGEGFQHNECALSFGSRSRQWGRGGGGYEVRSLKIGIGSSMLDLGCDRCSAPLTG